jgi:hypothetical protein
MSLCWTPSNFFFTLVAQFLVPESFNLTVSGEEPPLYHSSHANMSFVLAVAGLMHTTIS